MLPGKKSRDVSVRKQDLRSKSETDCCAFIPLASAVADTCRATSSRCSSALRQVSLFGTPSRPLPPPWSVLRGDSQAQPPPQPQPQLNMHQLTSASQSHHSLTTLTLILALTLPQARVTHRSSAWQRQSASRTGRLASAAAMAPNTNNPSTNPLALALRRILRSPGPEHSPSYHPRYTLATR